MKVIAWSNSPWYRRAVFLSLLCLSTAGVLFVSHKVETADFVRTLDHDSDITVHASGRGNPWINLQDGNALSVSFGNQPKGQMFTLESGATPTGMTAADFDEDGVPDLVCAFASTNGGTLTLHRGNVDSIFPYSPEAKQRITEQKFVDSPFLPNSVAVSLPERPDYLGAGDFDADGHWDVLTAAHGSNVLNFLRGDGRGGLIVSKQITLDGIVTSLAAGEINRSDGLTDLVLGVRNAESFRVLVFEGPGGALFSLPETFPLPAEAKDLAIGQLDEKSDLDLAVAAGSELLVIHGRDRKLSIDETKRQKVPQAVTTSYSFEAPITSITLGNFIGENHNDIAVLLSNSKVQVVTEREPIARKDISLPDDWTGATRLLRAKVSSFRHDDLVLVGEAKHQVHILGNGKEIKEVRASLDIEGEPAAALPMRLNADALDDLVILIKGQNAPTVVMTSPASIIEVNSTGDGSDCDLNDGVCSMGNIDPDTGKCVLTSECTLRAAIQQANSNAGLDSISFAIGAGVRTITPSSALPVITSPVILDGTTQPGFAGSPIIELNGVSVVGSGLTITSGSSTVRGLVINRFNGRGIALQTNGNNTIVGNYIGTSVSGTSDFGNSADGVFMSTGNNAIGGTSSSARNIISGNGANGVFMLGSAASENIVRGNYIGLTANGTALIGNFNGVVISGASDNVLGGTVAGSRNIISGNGQDGIAIVSEQATHNVVQGNFIGTDVAGAVDLGNTSTGVHIGVAPNNTVGGTSVAARNVISGNNSIGIWIHHTASTGNLVQGNYVGIGFNGTSSLGNSLAGVTISAGASNNTIGGNTATARNVVSANHEHGVVITESNTSENFVQGNYIGTDASGTADLGNTEIGVFIARTAADNFIGGTSAATRNIISGNDRDGIHINNEATENKVRGNYIGSDVTGTKDLGNTKDGITIDGAAKNFIGGTTSGSGNLISGNNGDGIQINGITATGNVVQGNSIGIQADGTASLPNAGVGVFISTSASNNLIGGRTDGAGNWIRNNGNDGVHVESGTGNTIVRNSISGNVGSGIDLGGPGLNGVTMNDPGDSDSGANKLQNFPELITASSSEAIATIGGTFQSEPGRRFTLDFYSNRQCDSFGFGEGESFITFKEVETGTNGNVIIDMPIGALPIGDQITVTATDSDGNTSEFSRCIVVTPKPKFTLTVTVGEGGSIVSIVTLPNFPRPPSECKGPNVCPQQYEEKLAITLTPHEDPGWAFIGWRGPCIGRLRECTVTMDSHKAVIATFVRVGERGRITSPIAVQPPKHIGQLTQIGYVFSRFGLPFPSTHQLMRSMPRTLKSSVGTAAEVDNVKVELSRNNGSTFETLFASIPDTGSACWTVTGPPTALALIRVTSLSDPSVFAISDEPFRIIESDVAGSTKSALVGSQLCEALSASDQGSQIRGNSFLADRYSFSGKAGQQLVLTLNSTAFDTYFYLIGPNGSVIAQDDNGGGGANSAVSSKRGLAALEPNATDSRIPSESGFFTLPTNGTYTIEVTSATANAVGPYQLALHGGPLLVTAEGTEQGIAFDSVIMTRDPFPLSPIFDFSPDHRTRVMLFALHADLLAEEDKSVVTAQAEDSQQRIVPLSVEFVGPVPGFSWVTQINVRLSDELAGEQMVWVSVNLRGSTSSKVQLKLVKSSQ